VGRRARLASLARASTGARRSTGGWLVALLAAVAIVAFVQSGLTEPPSAHATKRCGSFRVEGLLTKVRVKVVRGNVPCRNAKRVMKRLFNVRDTGKWNCVGPQTGYAACTRGDSKITARF
jgi:hypothetical protein